METDTAKGRVGFRSTRAALGSPKWDPRFSLDLKAELQAAKPIRRWPPKTLQLLDRGPGKGASAVGHTATSSSAQIDGALPKPEFEGPDIASTCSLGMAVRVAVRVNMPAIFQPVPSPLLSFAGGIVIRAVLAALLPSFLELLAADFGYWQEDGANRAIPADYQTGKLLQGSRPEMLQ